MENKIQTVLITGASTGLGLAISQLLLPQLKYRLILTARESSLKRFAEKGIYETDRIWIRALDITNPDQRDRIITEAETYWEGVDILINNAGVAFRAVVEHVTEQDRLAQMDINFRSPMALIVRVLPSMRAKRSGRIINISSAAGLMAMPTMSVYSASKFALEGATEALYYETKPWGIKVSIIQPGFINSSSFQNVRMTDASCRSSEDRTEAYSAYYRYMTPFIENVMRWTWATPIKVAKTVVRTMQKRHPPLRIKATADVMFFAMLRKVLPQSLYHAILYWNLPHIRKWVPSAEEGATQKPKKD